MIIILMGVSGSGKTVIGHQLASSLGWTFCDADDFHSSANVAKMQQGMPLNDADRRPWLTTLNQQITQWLAHQTPVVLACSALKASYRQQLCIDQPQVALVYLHGSQALLNQRLQQRHNHFMKSEMLQSQLETLEEPSDALWIEIDQAPDAIAAQIIDHLNL